MKTIVLLMSIGLLGWWTVVVPLQVIVAAVSYARGQWRLAGFSLAALALAVAGVGAARMVVDWHPDGFGQVGLVLPSGHSALAVVAVGTLALLAGPGRPRLRIAAAVATVLAVAWVMTLGGHTLGDVVVGLGLGGLSVLVAGLVSGLFRPFADRRVPQP
ncbi:membrane-associated phospholipid phosphatase [Inquilinus ginsengisoli]|uniref:Membrane-associated phospholipid phosphatase n=1 Tax=Inquilinus ginsengisoli TaxID=363840 RepID=A0ABU1JUR5_9PROT|nr:phosphatase PAP2 family protein [Inquilinus ginsengisoli]MDR6292032.1 membrane-associated phospholipid phosphatase [Inquilinus ginsengisoli]